MVNLKFYASNVHLHVQNKRHWLENNPTTKVKQFIWPAVSAISREEIQYLKVQQMASMSKKLNELISNTCSNLCKLYYMVQTVNINSIRGCVDDASGFCVK